MDRPPSSSSRRRYLSALTVVGAIPLAGCTADWSQPGATDVVVYNLASDTKVVSVTITDSREEAEHTSRTLEMAPNEKVDPVNRGKLPLNTEYEVEVSVEGGPSELFSWDDPEIEHALGGRRRQLEHPVPAGSRMRDEIEPRSLNGYTVREGPARTSRTHRCPCSASGNGER